MVASANQNNSLSHSEFLDVLSYDPSTGVFRWKKVGPGLSRGRARTGNVVGHAGRQGYRYFSIANVVYAAHRAAWFYVYGVWPKNLIDHINGNRDDNRISNLRDVTNLENQQNRLKNKGFRLPGTGKTPSGRWNATVYIGGGKRLYLGLFDTTEEAHAAYLKAVASLHIPSTGL